MGDLFSGANVSMGAQPSLSGLPSIGVPSWQGNSYQGGNPTIPIWQQEANAAPQNQVSYENGLWNMNNNFDLFGTNEGDYGETVDFPGQMPDPLSTDLSKYIYSTDENGHVIVDPNPEYFPDAAMASGGAVGDAPHNVSTASTDTPMYRLAQSLRQSAGGGDPGNTAAGLGSIYLDTMTPIVGPDGSISYQISPQPVPWSQLYGPPQTQVPAQTPFQESGLNGIMNSQAGGQQLTIPDYTQLPPWQQGPQPAPWNPGQGPAPIDPGQPQIIDASPLPPQFADSAQRAGGLADVQQVSIPSNVPGSVQPQFNPEQAAEPGSLYGPWGTADKYTPDAMQQRLWDAWRGASNLDEESNLSQILNDWVGTESAYTRNPFTNEDVLTAIEMSSDPNLAKLPVKTDFEHDWAYDQAMNDWFHYFNSNYTTSRQMTPEDLYQLSARVGQVTLNPNQTFDEAVADQATRRDLIVNEILSDKVDTANAYNAGKPNTAESIYYSPIYDRAMLNESDQSLFPAGGLASGGTVDDAASFAGALSEARTTNKNYSPEQMSQLVELVSEAVANPDNPRSQEIIQKFIQEFGEDELRRIIKMIQSGGGRPRGAVHDNSGDGMSDNVQASMDSGQGVRLSGGEYVIPADVVSGLGNGYTDAGIRSLDGMVSRVRGARTGV